MCERNDLLRACWWRCTGERRQELLRSGAGSPGAGPQGPECTAASQPNLEPLLGGALFQEQLQQQLLIEQAPAASQDHADAELDKHLSAAEVCDVQLPGDIHTEVPALALAECGWNKMQEPLRLPDMPRIRPSCCWSWHVSPTSTFPGKGSCTQPAALSIHNELTSPSPTTHSTGTLLAGTPQPVLS